MRTIVTRALVYFGLVFGAGFALGPVRVLWLAPRVGERNAELVEAPLMLLVVGFAARFIVRRFPSPQARAQLLSGALALALMLFFELTVVLGLRGLTVAEYVRSRDPLAGGVYVASLILFGLLPWLLARRRALQDGSADATNS